MKTLEKIKQIEHQVMKVMLLDDAAQRDILYDQYKNCINCEYKITKCGFFVDYTLNSDQVLFEYKGSFELSNVELVVDGVDIDVILFINHGAINMLECVTYGAEEFPKWLKKIKCRLIAA
jgi:hypothetical protein